MSYKLWASQCSEFLLMLGSSPWVTTFLPLDHIKDLTCQSMSKSGAGIQIDSDNKSKSIFQVMTALVFQFYSDFLRRWLEPHFCSCCPSRGGRTVSFYTFLQTTSTGWKAYEVSFFSPRVFHKPLFWSSLIVFLLWFSCESFLCQRCQHWQMKE